MVDKKVFNWFFKGCGLPVMIVIVILATITAPGVVAQTSETEGSERQLSSKTALPMHQPSGDIPDADGYTGSIIMGLVSGITTENSGLSAPNNHITIHRTIGDDPDEAGYSGVISVDSFTEVTSESNPNQTVRDSDRYSTELQPDMDAYYGDGKHSIP